MLLSNKMSKAKEDTKISRIESLPREIMLDIVSRLPITTLIQSKVVCRSWSDIIRDSSLVRIHLARTKNHDPCIIMQIIPPIQNEMYFVGFSAHNKDIGTVKKISPMTPKFKVVCSCDGLLCLSESINDAIYICNPLVGTCTKLPNSTFMIRVVLGFGFNSKTKEYKVLVSVSTVSTGTQLHQRLRTSDVTQYNVLTIGSSTWRKLEDKFYDFVLPSLQVLVHERLHWTTRPIEDNEVYHRRFHWNNIGRDRTTYSIISFDLAEERFREVERPACGSLDNVKYQLVELRGCLSAAVECEDGTMKIWVLKKYDEKDSWIIEFVIGAYVPKQLKIDRDESYNKVRFLSSGGSLSLVLCLQKNNEILFQYNCRHLVSYNPLFGTFTEHVFPGMPSLFASTVHVGSLNHVERLMDN